MAARSVGLSVISLEVVSSSPRLRFCRARTVFWFCARRSARCARVWRRMPTLSRAKANATASRVTSVPNSTSRAPRLLPASQASGASRDPDAGRSVGDGNIFQGNGEIDRAGASRLNHDLAADRPGALVPRRDGVLPGRKVGEVEGPLGAGGGEEGIVEHQDDAAHIGVDVAENLHDAGLVEADR